MKAQEVNCTPWSEWITVVGEVTLVPAAMDSASLTKADSGRRSMAQPTTLREKRSKTTQQ